MIARPSEKQRVDSYMPCGAMAHMHKSHFWPQELLQPASEERLE